MSTHVIPVIEIKQVLPHPNADKLDLIPVGGWQCAVQKGSFKPGDLSVYIEPDFMVPVTRPEFAFLRSPGKFDQTYTRIKAKKLRGTMSYGLLIPVPDVIRYIDHMGVHNSWRTHAGMNLIDYYGIHRWEPPAVSSTSTGAFNALAQADLPALPGVISKFDLENLNNYLDVLDHRKESVVVTEKIHGANARYLWWDGIFYVGSRGQWLKPPAEGDKRSAWHTAAHKLPQIERWCQEHEGTILYGEIYGNVQDLKYGLPNDVTFAAFAANDTVTGKWWDTLALFASLDAGRGVPRVPVLACGRISRKMIEALMEDDSQVATAPTGHMKEGVVITPEFERLHPDIGRVSLKLISNRYWERKL